MTYRSDDDAPSWGANWHSLLRAFPALTRAPEAQQQGFHERFSKLDQRLVAMAIERARESKTGNTITVEYLQKGYARLVPRYDAEQPSMAARIVSYWSFAPRGTGRAAGPFRTAREAERAGGRPKALWVKPGDGSWFADLEDTEPLPREDQCDALLHVEALMSTLPRHDDKGTWHLTEPGHFQQFVDGGRALLAAPPRTPPLGVEAPEERASPSEASSRRALHTSSTGGLSTPPNGIRDAGGLRLPTHRLSDEMVERFEAAIDRRDDGSPYGATAPGGRGGEA
jgi:hypothetical protein